MTTKAAGWVGLYDRILDAIDRVASLLVIVTMGVMTTVISMQVFWRYVLNSSLDWSWDVPRLCFIWATLLAIPLAFKRHAHVGIDLLTNLLSHSARNALFRFNIVVMIVMMAIVAYYAVILADRVWLQYLTTINLSVGLFYVALVVCAIHCILHMARQFISPPEKMFSDGEIE
jgi:TRAP-type C4-dicarboxylate transport system permease small subunit